MTSMMIVKPNAHVFFLREQEKTRIDAMNGDAVWAVIKYCFRGMNYWSNIAFDTNLFDCLSARGIFE